MDVPLFKNVIKPPSNSDHNKLRFHILCSCETMETMNEPISSRVTEKTERQRWPIFDELLDQSNFLD